MVPRVRTAFVLGAGLGTRLRPLTNVTPKPLLPIFGKRLITFALDHLIASGVERFVINTHHLSEQFAEFFSDGSYRSKKVVLIHEPDLLETGGGIFNAASFFRHEPFLVYSGDILTDIDVGALVDFHFRSGSQVTLALRHTGLATDLSFDPTTNRVVDIREQLGSGLPGNVDFANVSVWNPEMIEKIPAGRKISFVPVLAEAIRDREPIGGVVLDERHWFNIGSREQYLEIHRVIARGPWRPSYLTEANWPTTIAHSAIVSEGVDIAGACWIGPESRIESGASLRDVVVWPHSKVRSGAHLDECVVAGVEAGPGTFCRTDFV
jgi:mannose-1-phosphate guanylyltransferase